MHWIVDTVRHFLVAWGYWAVILGLIGEDAGLPLPGETILIFASFLAYKHHKLQVIWIIVAGVIAATIGDNIGYWIGRKGGRPLLDKWKRFFRVSDDDIAAGEELIKRKGANTVFFARFVWGLRMIAGPLSGALKMDWRRFLLFNFLGAAAWVTAIALLGYTFASHFNTLLGFFKKADIAVVVAVAALGYWFWHRHKNRQRKQKQFHEVHPNEPGKR
ncbi:MAG TPA: DedA family protein [Candidatus Angelobacter sp.]|nr:DedA family protein [Candidatus Angelobacter sp.]